MTDRTQTDLQKTIDARIAEWRQGDCALGEHWFAHRVDPAQPLTEAAREASNANVDLAESLERGIVVVTQTCDIVRSCEDRPFVEVAPLVEVEEHHLLEVRRGYRPRYAYVPGVSDQRLVADLDRVMSAEKAVLTIWQRVVGCTTDSEIRSFAQALGRKRARFAFPNDFVAVVRKLQARMTKKHERDSDEGRGLRALREIRVRAAPSWNAQTVDVTFWFVRDDDDPSFGEASWDRLLETWLALVPPAGRFESVNGVVTTLDDLTARDLVDSDLLDLDHLSSGGRV